jgi:DNA-binding NarL/FixJ family response regulator
MAASKPPLTSKRNAASATGTKHAVKSAAMELESAPRRYGQSLRARARAVEGLQMITNILNLCVSTVEAHRWQAMEKLNLRDTAGFVGFELRKKLIAR